MRSSLAIAPSVLLLVSCVAPSPAPQPAPKPTPVVVAPAPPPAVVRPAGEWIDWPLAPGSWVYRSDARGSIALFGAPNADALITLRCDKARGRLYLSRAGSVPSGTITVRTSTTLKTLPAQPTGTTPPYVATELAPNDAILDAMAYSRGRLAIEAGDLQPVAIPVWAEIGRVVEDCRP